VSPGSINAADVGGRFQITAHGFDAAVFDPDVALRDHARSVENARVAVAALSRAFTGVPGHSRNNWYRFSVPVAPFGDFADRKLLI